MGHVIARRLANFPGGFELPAPVALVGVLLLAGIAKAGHGTWAIIAIAMVAAICALVRWI